MKSRGLKYFPLVTDFFQDRDIRRLMLSHGETGVLLYMYILCAIYAKSYYIQWNEDMLFDASLDLRRDAGELQTVVDYLLDKGFFDRGLYRRRSVLTSPAVQRQFQDCARVMKRKPKVDSSFWLLAEDETYGGIVFVCEGQASELKGDNSEVSAENSEVLPQKKIKENKNKLNESGESKEAAGEPQGGAALTTPPPTSWAPPLTRGGKGACDSEASELAASGADKAEDIVTTYRKKLYLSNRDAEELRGYGALLGAELCLHALERSEEMDRLQWNYVRSILRRYKQNNFRSMEQVFEEERQHKSRYGRSPPNEVKQYSAEQLEGLLKDLEMR